MSAPGAGILLALSGDDADILRALSQSGSGLCVVRRCADLPELLSAGMAGLASFALLDTGFDEIDRTVLDRLGRASAGWPVLSRDSAPSRIRSVMQDLVRRGAAGTGASSPASSIAAGTALDAPARPAATSNDWLSAATPPSPASSAPTASHSAAQETAWLEELWRQSPGPDGAVEAPAPPGPMSFAPGPGAFAGGPSGPGRAQRAVEGSPEDFAVPPSVAPGRSHTVMAASGAAGGSHPGSQASALDGGRGRIVLVWGPHCAPGRSTVAASLAYGLAASGGAILVDADVEAPSLVQILGMPEDSSALAGAARLATHGRLDAESFQRVLATGRAGTGRALAGAAASLHDRGLAPVPSGRGLDRRRRRRWCHRR